MKPLDFKGWLAKQPMPPRTDLWLRQLDYGVKLASMSSYWWGDDLSRWVQGIKADGSRWEWADSR